MRVVILPTAHRIKIEWQRKKTMRGEFYLLMATLLAAVGWIASKIVITAVPGEIFIVARFLLASIILFPFLLPPCFVIKCQANDFRMRCGSYFGAVNSGLGIRRFYH